jgi:hypothetical protein
MVRENEQSKISVLGQYAQGFWRIDKFGKKSEKNFHLRNLLLNIQIFYAMIKIRNKNIIRRKL